MSTVLLSGRDPKPHRPAVVIALPAFGLESVQLLTRTSDTSRRGIHHPADASLGLTKPGVFAFEFQRSMDERFFGVPTAARFLGMLPPQYFAQITAWWEAV